MNTNIHSCSYYCNIPECIKAQRDHLRTMVEERPWFGLAPQDEADIAQSVPEDATEKALAYIRATEARLKWLNK